MNILSNVYVDVLRSSYTTTTGTDVATLYLTHVKGQLTRIKDSPLVPFGASFLRAEYELHTDIHVDITKGDRITNIIRKDNGLPWFAAVQGTDNETMVVLDAVNSSPGFLEYRDIVLGRFVGGGPG